MSQPGHVCPRCGERNPQRARFCMTCAAPLAPAGARAEDRRVVTVVFADVTGSTELGERLDAEAVRRAMTGFYGDARGALERHGGTVEKFIGDAVMAVFGVPRLRPDDAARAVVAALDLRDTLAARNAELVERYGVALNVRIGVNTGEVVAGDPSTGSSFVAGDTVNTTARLEQAAPPGEVLAGEETYRLTRDLVEAEQVESLRVKGKRDAVSAFRLLRLREAGVEPQAPLVGRDGAVAAVTAAFHAAVVTGAPRLVLLSGDPGAGKTRLLDEAVVRLQAEATVLRARCFREGEADEPAIAAAIRQALPGAAGPDDLRGLMRDLAPGHERAPVIIKALARLLGFAGATTIEEQAWGVQRLLELLAARRPVVLAIDDAHAADPTTLAVLEALTTAPRVRAPLLAVCSARADVDALPWVDEAVELAPLADPDAELLARAALGQEADPEVVRRVVAVAEGNPLFLWQTALLLRGDVTAGSLAALPTTIRAVLAARLDELPGPRTGHAGPSRRDRTALPSRRTGVARSRGPSVRVPASDAVPASPPRTGRGRLGDLSAGACRRRRVRVADQGRPRRAARAVRGLV